MNKTDEFFGPRSQWSQCAVVLPGSRGGFRPPQPTRIVQSATRARGDTSAQDTAVFDVDDPSFCEIVAACVSADILELPPVGGLHRPDTFPRRISFINAKGARAATFAHYEKSAPFDEIWDLIWIQIKRLNRRKAESTSDRRSSGEATAAFLGEAGEWSEVMIQYSDVHGFHGGHSVQIAGSGEVVVTEVTPRQREEGSYPLYERRLRMQLAVPEAHAIIKDFIRLDFITICLVRKEEHVLDATSSKINLCNGRGERHEVYDWRVSTDRRASKPGDLERYDKLEKLCREMIKWTEGLEPEDEGWKEDRFEVRRDGRWVRDRSK